MTIGAGSRPIVLDTSVALAWILRDEPLRDAALAVEGSIRSGDLEPIVATNFGFELRHSLVRAARRGRIDWSDVIGSVADVEGLQMTSPQVSYAEIRLLELCRTRRISWSDAHHVWLARTTDRPLVTADRRLVRSMEGSAVWLAYLGDRPDDEAASQLQPGQRDRDEDVEQQPEGQ